MKRKFPIIIVRKGGGKFDLLSKINKQDLQTITKNIFSQKKALEKEKKSIIDKVHNIIKHEKNDTSKKVLLNYKRDLFNNRSIKKHILKISNEEIKKDLIRFYRKKKKHEKNRESFKPIFNEELLKSIENIKEITETSFFKNGIFFSSEILHNQINKTDFKFSKINKKNKKLVSSVLKYLTRSITKTTPYSSFTKLCCLKYDNQNYFTNKIAKDYSTFQITNLFFHYLKLFLLKKNEFKNILEIDVNSTISIRKELNMINYFYNKENNESFKSIENNQVLSFMHDFLKSTPHSKYEVLILKLQSVTDESKENIISYIETLINEGFLILKYPISSTNQNWIYDLKKKLHQVPFSNLELKEDLLILLNFINNNINKIGIITDIDDKKTIQEIIYESIISFFNKYDLDSGFLLNVKKTDLLYEDSIGSIAPKIKVSSIDKLSNELIILQNTFNKILNYKKELNKFLTTFLIKDKKNILDFYEEIYLKNSQSFFLKEKSLIHFNEIVSKSISKINSSKNIKDIDISTFFKPEFLNNTENVSFGAYFQTENDNLDRVILNNLSNGKGANISRFLNSFPKEYAKEVKEYNKNSKFIIVEVKDASIHNTNTFPTLCESLISVDEDLVLKDSRNLTSLKKIFVSKNDLDELILINEEGKEIEPQIFSIEAINRKSKFTQFLDIFNKTDNLGFNFYLKSLNDYYKKLNKNISTIPRLVFKEKIIIQRKKWFVKKKHLQKALNKTTLSENFLSINEWVFKNKIPSKVFIKISERDLKNNQNDNYKPQFIDFKSPIFMLLTINLIEKADEVIEITEMYPNTDHINKNDGYIKEFVININ
ncbi:lantibiotic dehydratase [Tenacibaculum ovolyticum]|uniref:lantibiotic dehydratase n=1 Tax=Tenacibaculum ovolyticum TaxID=104270 RepID=UPI003BACD90A